MLFQKIILSVFDDKYKIIERERNQIDEELNRLQN